MTWKSHEIIITPILFLLEMILCKHPIVALSFLFLFPYFTLFLFFLLLLDQLAFSLPIPLLRVAMNDWG